MLGILAVPIDEEDGQMRRAIMCGLRAGGFGRSGGLEVEGVDEAVVTSTRKGREKKWCLHAKERMAGVGVVG